MFTSPRNKVNRLLFRPLLVALLACPACQIAGVPLWAAADQLTLSPTSAKVLRYAARVVRDYDRDRSGRLESPEWQSMRGDPKEADVDGDGVIALEELAQRISQYGARRRIQLRTSDPAATTPAPPLPATAGQEATASLDPLNPTSATPDPRITNRTFFIPRTLLPQGVPDWFIARDANGDGQLTMSEFTELGGRAEMNQFTSLDANGDGLVTASEYAKTSKEQPPSEAK